MLIYFREDSGSYSIPAQDKFPWFHHNADPALAILFIMEEQREYHRLLCLLSKVEVAHTVQLAKNDGLTKHSQRYFAQYEEENLAIAAEFFHKVATRVSQTTSGVFVEVRNIGHRLLPGREIPPEYTCLGLGIVMIGHE